MESLYVQANDFKKKTKRNQNLNCDIRTNQKNIFLRKKHDVNVSKERLDFIIWNCLYE